MPAGTSVYGEACVSVQFGRSDSPTFTVIPAAVGNTTVDVKLQFSQDVAALDTSKLLVTDGHVTDAHRFSATSFVVSLQPATQVCVCGVVGSCSCM
jgi:hypothetical protein